MNIESNLPFEEQDNIRIFDQDVDEMELVWHRDREDRIVEALETTDWMFQLDNNLPQRLEKIFIPKDTYHRVIKGSGNLKVKVTKL